MLHPLDTGIRRTAALFAAVGLVALVLVPAAASKPVAGQNEPSIQDILTQGHNWAAKARLLDVNEGVRTGALSSAQDVLTQRRWAAQGHLVDGNGSVFRKSLPMAHDIQTQGENWAAKARLLDVNGGLLQKTLPSAQDLQTRSDNWAAKGRLLNANGGLLKATQSKVSANGGFDWHEFGIGVGAALALVLLLGIVAVGLHVHDGSMRQGRAA